MHENGKRKVTVIKYLITYFKKLTNICELKGTHKNNGHPHQNNILTMIDMLL
jgi:hypothetical protein